ncbi:MAG: glycosyltransferase family 2 protein [Candidatus Omnitrophica bacterium]|nr:glycosyltransferase family 2 protein [Candidatus Omnitrophota bacterium]
MNILAVIPAHNEASAIAVVSGGVKALGHEVLVVDDGSTDATADLAGQAGAVVLSTGQKSGKGNALRLGFDYAVKNGYEAVIALDGDGQHDPGDIKLFLESHARTGASIINGNRMADPRGMPFIRLATNTVMSWIISLICRQHIPDTQCGFRFMTTDVLRNIQLECRDFEIETELLVKASRKGFKITSVPVTTIYRNETSKIKPARDTMRFIRFIIRTLGQK